MKASFSDIEFAESFWKKVDKLENGCWEWAGKTNPAGYGKCWLRGKELYAHRVSYQLTLGSIPTEKVIDHLCRNKRCVNPYHLEIVTQKENVLRGNSVFAKRKKQTHCIHGHPLSGYNLIVYKNGTRHCRACARIWDAARSPRQRIWIGIEDK